MDHSQDFESCSLHKLAEQAAHTLMEFDHRSEVLDRSCTTAAHTSEDFAVVFLQAQTSEIDHRTLVALAEWKVVWAH